MAYDSNYERLKREMDILGIKGESEENIQKVSQELGYFPYSVMRVNNDKALAEVVSDDMRTNTYLSEKYKSDPAYRLDTKKKGYSSALGDGLSRFNPAVAKRLVEFYTKEGDVVLTPYGSFGVITIIAAHLNRVGIVNELVPRYAKHIQNVIDGLNEKGSKGLFKKVYNATVNCGNANDMSFLEDESVDCVITSPPFADVEKYESVDGQLSDISDYDKFLEEYDLCNKEIFRVMKPGGICVFVVNDFRRGGKLIRFSTDTEHSLQRAGFETWDIGINFLYSTPGVIGARRARENKQFIKAHEYFIVMRKPE